VRFLASLLAALLGACAPLPPPPLKPPVPTMGEYKRDVAQRIVQVNAHTYSARPPEVLKSIVVLEITVDNAGQATAVSVYRSNGYAHLEERALASVAKAAPFTPPARALLDGAPSVTFLETFLFREDELFQVRSLVPNEKLF
jgi:TonB family protein